VGLFRVEDVPVECDDTGLKSQAIPVVFLSLGDYVLLAEDADDPHAADPVLLVDVDAEGQVLWRYMCVSEQDPDGTLHLSFDGGPEELAIEVPVAPTARIRRILPGQEDLHETWEMP
jgi:hypothetical protein